MTVKGRSAQAALAEIAALPLEQRYVWRIASVLKWAFADFDNLNVAAERETLAPADRATLADLLRLRPIQFCLFLAALYGEDAMQQTMASAVAAAQAAGEDVM